jgi:hypothetical protein
MGETRKYTVPPNTTALIELPNADPILRRAKIRKFHKQKSSV